MNQDEQHLDLLSIFHYVVGGITALLSCIPFLHVAIGIAMLCGAFEGHNPPPRSFGWVPWRMMDGGRATWIHPVPRSVMCGDVGSKGGGQGAHAPGWGQPGRERHGCGAGFPSPASGLLEVSFVIMSTNMPCRNTTLCVSDSNR